MNIFSTTFVRWSLYTAEGSQGIHCHNSTIRHLHTADTGNFLKSALYTYTVHILGDSGGATVKTRHSKEFQSVLLLFIYT